MTPVFGRTLEKREAYSVHLRKKKRQEILTHKRGKILQHMQQNGMMMTEEEQKMLVELNTEAVQAEEAIDP